MFHKRHLRLLSVEVPRVNSNIGQILFTIHYISILQKLLFFSLKLRVSLGHFPICYSWGPSTWMWLPFHTSTQVGKSSHIEIGQDPRKKATLMSRVVLSFLLVLSLSCRQTDMLWKLQGVSGTSDVIGKKEKRRKKKQQKKNQTRSKIKHHPFPECLI